MTKQFRHCRHFDYRHMKKNGECYAGINPIQKFCDNETFGWLVGCPCYEKNEDTKVCSERNFPSWEEVKEQERKMDEVFDLTLTAVRQIPKVEGTGTIPCPVCNDIIDWARASYNGHLAGRCRTNGCIYFME